MDEIRQRVEERARQAAEAPPMGATLPATAPTADTLTAAPAPEKVNAVTEEKLREFTRELLRYKSGKASAERRAIDAESWWHLRNQIMREEDTSGMSGFNAKSGWLHNVIVSKHSDLMEAYPEANILPREQGDTDEAEKLRRIIPVILEQNHYSDVYSDKCWQKLKTGTGITKIYWDATKLNGLGDIAIDRVDILNVFWEPGITDIQKSKYFFHTAVMDRERIEEQYPALKSRLRGGGGFTPQKFRTDDSVTDENKVTVIDCYYKTHRDGGTQLHYCKYVGDTVLYSSEDEGRPLYDHGLYPFVFDTLYPIEGSPAGYGFVDLGANIQEQLDMMQTAFIKNTMVGAVPRYFTRSDGSVNEEELLDIDRPLVHVDGQLGQDSLRLIDYKPLSGNYLNMRQYTIEELRQTTGNTETANGSTPSGVTAASAIAALQEAAGKGSRDATRTTYRAFEREIYLVIELLRQFYDLPRQFRITGDMGRDSFESFDNSGLALQATGAVGGQSTYRLPVFDIKVEPAKRTAYSRITQNELAIQFFTLGFFNPQMTDQALNAVQMMDFDGKDDVTRMIARNGTMAQRLAQAQQLILALTAKYEPERTQEVAAAFMGQQPLRPRAEREKNEIPGDEDARVTRARAQSRGASQIE